MKIIQKNLSLVDFIPVLLTCDNYETPLVIPRYGANLYSPAADTHFVLIQQNSLIKNPFKVFTANFEDQAKRTYTLEIDFIGADFANPTESAIPTTYIIELTPKNFNSDLILKEFTGKATSNAEFGIKSTYPAQKIPLYSISSSYLVILYSSIRDSSISLRSWKYEHWIYDN